MNIKAISRNVGSALLFSALFMFFSIIVSILNGNDSALAALSISFVITFITGVFPFIFVRKSSVISVSDGYMIIVLAWLLSFLFGMLPYVLWGGPFTFINALFESVSGYTTTGATILSNVQALPHSLLFWRSSTHFIGGFGVIVFLLLIIPSSSPVRLRLSNMEISSLIKENYGLRANKTVNIFISTYLGLILASFLSYWIAGMSPFNAINHAFSVCATGGFSTMNLSIAAFHSLPITVITMIFMYLSSIHFGIIYFTFANRSLKPLANPVLKFYTKTIVFASILITFLLKFSDQTLTWFKAFMDSSFQVISLISATGFGSADDSHWPLLVCTILTILMLMCGCAGSTTGGIKVDRIVLFFRAVKRQIRKSLHPTAMEEVKMGGHTFDDEEISSHVIFTLFYVCLVFLSVVLTMAAKVDPFNAFMATVSCFGNVGPATGAMGTLGNYGGCTSIAKFIFVVDMFIGRLEIFPFLAVLSYFFTRSKT